MTLKVLGDTLMDELEVGLLLDCSVAASPEVPSHFLSNIRNLLPKLLSTYFLCSVLLGSLENELAFFQLFTG